MTHARAHHRTTNLVVGLDLRLQAFGQIVVAHLALDALDLAAKGPAGRRVVRKEDGDGSHEKAHEYRARLIHTCKEKGDPGVVDLGLGMYQPFTRKYQPVNGGRTLHHRDRVVQRDGVNVRHVVRAAVPTHSAAAIDAVLNTTERRGGGGGGRRREGKICTGMFSHSIQEVRYYSSTQSACVYPERRLSLKNAVPAWVDDRNPHACDEMDNENVNEGQEKNPVETSVSA